MEIILSKIHSIPPAGALFGISILSTILLALYLAFRYKKITSQIFECIDSYAPDVIEKYGGSRASFPLTKFACFADSSMPFGHGYSLFLTGSFGVSEQFQTIGELRQMLDRECVAYALLDEAHQCLHYALMAFLAGGVLFSLSVMLLIVFGS